MIAGGAWRNFPGLMHLHDHFLSDGTDSAKRWFVFVDDDTYVYPSSLARTLSAFDPTLPHYLGLYHTPRIDLEWKEVHLAYASGGAGYVLSAAALRRHDRAGRKSGGRGAERKQQEAPRHVGRAENNRDWIRE